MSVSTVDMKASVVRGKDQSIESLRGLAAIFMVAGHVIGGGDGARGMQVGPGSGWAVFYECLEDIRMPLFTMLSGFVFALRPPMAAAAYPGLVRSKVRRLLVPMLVVGTVLFFSQYLIPASNSRPHLGDYPWIFFYSFQHLWFLQAVFLIFLVVGILEVGGVLATRPRFLIVLALTSVGHMFAIIPSPFNVFSVNSAIQLLPFFLIGYGLRRHGFFAGSAGSVAGVVIVFAAAYGFRLMQITGHAEVGHRWETKLAAFAVGVSAVILLYVLRHLIRNRVLSWMGGFAFGIYLLHVFATAGSRVVVTHLGVGNLFVVFTVSLAAGVAFPIVFQILLGRFDPVRVLVLGERARKSGRHRLRSRERAQARSSGVR
ncbi:acyltransferase [uncultured Williamsia sp.]|uniref:acyltransferase family protein n=1 Tax=uncultured Williamsia sp. TaxID=259311 RepID=UPI002623B62F|nr:acyltransferase [uncultured Williamsia sp.]